MTNPLWSRKYIASTGRARKKLSADDFFLWRPPLLFSRSSSAGRHLIDKSALFSRFLEPLRSRFEGLADAILGRPSVILECVMARQGVPGSQLLYLVPAPVGAGR